MKKFSYKALNVRGELMSGSVYADSEEHAIRLIRNEGQYPTQIHKNVDKDEPITDAEGPSQKVKRKKFVFGKWSVFWIGYLVGSVLTYITILTLY